MSDEKYLTAAQVASRLGVKPMKVSGWCRAGRLPYINTGSQRKPRYKIDPKDLDKLKETPAQPVASTRRGRVKEVVSRY